MCVRHPSNNESGWLPDDTLRRGASFVSSHCYLLGGTGEPREEGGKKVNATTVTRIIVISTFWGIELESFRPFFSLPLPLFPHGGQATFFGGPRGAASFFRRLRCGLPLPFPTVNPPSPVQSPGLCLSTLIDRGEGWAVVLRDPVTVTAAVSWFPEEFKSAH